MHPLELPRPSVGPAKSRDSARTFETATLKASEAHSLEGLKKCGGSCDDRPMKLSTCAVGARPQEA